MAIECTFLAIFLYPKKMNGMETVPETTFQKYIGPLVRYYVPNFGLENIFILNIDIRSATLVLISFFLRNART